MLTKFKGIVHTKKKILWWFTHPTFVPNQADLGHHWHVHTKRNTKEDNAAPKLFSYKHSFKYLPLCSEKIHLYRFGTTAGE